MTANFILLDLLLARYGPDTNAARDLLRGLTVGTADRLWRENNSEPAKAAPFRISGAVDAFYDKLSELSPNTDIQRSLKARAA